jgi:ABC-2 type transport system ATP-binding protein
MKDVAALCRRAVIIARGRIIHDGPITDITGQFAGQKIITLQMADDRVPEGLERYGELLSVEVPRVRIRVDRHDVTRVLSDVLARHAVADVSVEDPPLEEVIAEVFRKVVEEEQGTMSDE